MSDDYSPTDLLHHTVQQMQHHHVPVASRAADRLLYYTYSLTSTFDVKTSNCDTQTCRYYRPTNSTNTFNRRATAKKLFYSFEQ